MKKIKKAETAGQTRLNQPSTYSLSKSDQNVNAEYSVVSKQADQEYMDAVNRGDNVYGADVALDSAEQDVPAGTVGSRHVNLTQKVTV